MQHYATLRVKGSEEVVDIYNKVRPVTHKPLSGARTQSTGSVDLVTADGRPVNRTGESSYLILDMYGDNDIELEQL